MKLHLVAAVQTHFRHAADGGEAVGQLIVGIIVQFIQLPVPGQIKRDDRKGVDVDFGYGGRFHFRREILHDGIDLFTDVVYSQVDIYADLKLQRHGADVFHADGSRMFQSVERGNGIFDPPGDFDLNLFRRRTRIGSRDLRVGNVNAGNKVDTDFPVGVQTEQNQHDDKTAHRNGTFDRDGT